MIFALALAACTSENGDPGLVLVGEPTLTPSEAVTPVATLTFTTDAAVAARVRFGAGDWEVVTPLDEPGTEHRIVLVGAPADTEVTWHLEDEAGVEAASGAWTTGSLPGGLPPLTVTGDDFGGWLLTTVLGGVYAVLMLNPQGQTVWYHVDDSGLELVRAVPAADGSGVVYTVGDVSGDPSAESRVVRVSWDGEVVESTTVPYLAQDFVQAADGTIVSITAEVRDGPDGEPLKGNGLVEIPPDGGWAPIWSSWDCFDPEVTPGNDPNLGWTWANAIDAAPDGFVLGLRNFSALVWIDSGGACGRVFGGPLSDYDFPGESFRHAHQFEVDGDRVLLFDNDGAGANQSRALEFVLDEGAGTATDVWTYVPDTGAASFVLGDVHRYDDGSTLVDFSLAGQIDRVDAAGAVLTRATSPIGYAFGYTTVMATPQG